MKKNARKSLLNYVTFFFPIFCMVSVFKGRKHSSQLTSGFSVDLSRQKPQVHFFSSRKLYGIPQCSKSNTEHITSFAFLSSHKVLYCIVLALVQFLASKNL